MKKFKKIQILFSLLLIVCFLSPVAALALGDGKKHFRAGIKYEQAEQWDKAAEEFALAVADNPRNTEYRLHYQRALFNASQMYMKRGSMLAEEKDYVGAFNAYRRAYAYDPVNELAKAEMEKMVRLQEGLQTDEKSNKKDSTDLRVVPTGYNVQQQQQQDTYTPRLEKHRDVPFPSGVDLFFLIKELARDLDLNVLFDKQLVSRESKIKIELKNVTSAKALDYIFLQEGLFFQKVGPRTILVAEQTRRQNFQQLVLRTFYLSNANPEDIQKILPQAIPAQPGRTPTTVMIDKATNSITVRDTQENIGIIGKLIKAWDKDRAEVVMDVNIFEVSKTDLLKLGNQIGTADQLGQLGISTPGLVNVGGSAVNSIAQAIRNAYPTAMASALLIPSSSLSAFQSKGTTKLLASTQVHAFNGEKSTAKIGQRVPVRSATYVNTGNIAGNAPIADVINYEQTGLTLSFEPLVFPNQDVQVKMEITSRDLAGSGINGNPIFGEREIKGSARIQNNRTLLLASVAQNREQNTKQGLPLLGLIPVLGRLFVTPTRDDSQVDIVIAVTPRVLRAPSILPEDEVERPTGSLATPTNSSLEAMVIEEDREELLAAARRLPTTAWVQLPDNVSQDTPKYVAANASTNSSPSVIPQNSTGRQPQYDESIRVETETTSAAKSSNIPERKQISFNEKNPAQIVASVSPQQAATNIVNPPAQAKSFAGEETTAINVSKASTQSTNGVKTLRINVPDVPVKEEPKAKEPVSESVKPEPTAEVLPDAQFRLLTAFPFLKRGAIVHVPVQVSTATPFRSAIIGLNFDAAKVAVKSVTFGEVFGKEAVQKRVEPYLNTGGKMFVSVSGDQDLIVSSSGILAYIELEALQDGVPEIALDPQMNNLMTADGKYFHLSF